MNGIENFKGRTQPGKSSRERVRDVRFHRGDAKRSNSEVGSAVASGQENDSTSTASDAGSPSNIPSRFTRSVGYTITKIVTHPLSASEHTLTEFEPRDLRSIRVAGEDRMLTSETSLNRSLSRNAKGKRSQGKTIGVYAKTASAQETTTRAMPAILGAVALSSAHIVRATLQPVANAHTKPLKAFQSRTRMNQHLDMLRERNREAAGRTAEMDDYFRNFETSKTFSFESTYKRMSDTASGIDAALEAIEAQQAAAQR
ncbi:hypothetical protein N7373_18480 [Achromobacter mucicolens]|uniref:hypothetical protein n=1 Tax=Achromobacter mucicolens TaxID=1389922 RepID=UPI00244B2BA2|nr:hypothetical protein [Achromobacter mucicolens]MDH0093445.1 hypothetical protein [Achromobacter mucicolens]